LACEIERLVVTVDPRREREPKRRQVEQRMFDGADTIDSS